MYKKTLTILIGLLLSLGLTTSQNPPKKQEPQDTVRSIVDRPADSLYMQQMATKMKLDSIYEEKSKK